MRNKYGKLKLHVYYDSDLSDYALKKEELESFNSLLKIGDFTNTGNIGKELILEVTFQDGAKNICSSYRISDDKANITFIMLDYLESGNEIDLSKVDFEIDDNAVASITVDNAVISL